MEIAATKWYTNIDTEDTVYLEEDDKSAGSQGVLSSRWDKS